MDGPFHDGSIPRYRFLTADPVGAGGCGVVWPAIDRLFDSKVAFKTLQPDLLARLPEQARRTFWKEAQAGARLGQISSNIVQVLDYGLVESQPYFTMEWLTPKPGNSLDLSSMIGAATVSEAVGVGLQVGSALRTAHQKGIIHSDIAPWNILRTDAGIVKLADFGLLVIVEEQLLTIGSGSLLKGGRADFQPPEVRVSIKNLTKSADVYALATTILTLLVGAAVLPSTSGRPIDIRDGMVAKKEQRIFPAALTELFRRFIPSHTQSDTIEQLLGELERIPR